MNDLPAAVVLGGLALAALPTPLVFPALSWLVLPARKGRTVREWLARKDSRLRLLPLGVGALLCWLALTTYLLSYVDVVTKVG